MHGLINLRHKIFSVSWRYREVRLYLSNSEASPACTTWRSTFPSYKTPWNCVCACVSPLSPTCAQNASSCDKNRGIIFSDNHRYFRPNFQGVHTQWEYATCECGPKGIPFSSWHKVKWSHYKPGVTQRVGRGIALLFHDRGTRRGWVVSSTPRPHFIPEKDPVLILHEVGWAHGPVWKGWNSRHHRDSIPDRPARSQSLYQPSYLAHLDIRSKTI